MSLAKKISIGVLCLGAITELSFLGLICNNKPENELFKRYCTNAMVEGDYRSPEYQKIIENERYVTFGLGSYLVTVSGLIATGSLLFSQKKE